MKKTLISAMGATLLFTGFGFSDTTFAQEQNIPLAESQQNEVAYTKEFILKQLENTEEFALVLPYTAGSIELPEGYISTLVSNPDTNLSFYKIENEIQTIGFKKTAIVWAFRYGGEALGIVMDVVNDDAADYIRKNSGKIADAIEDASDMVYGAIYQSLLSAGVPTAIARNIAWAIDAFLL